MQSPELDEGDRMVGEANLALPCSLRRHLTRASRFGEELLITMQDKSRGPSDALAESNAASAEVPVTVPGAELRAELNAGCEVGQSADPALAVQQHFEATLAHQKETAQLLRKKKLNWVVFRFVTTWIFFLLILLVFGLLTHLEWARPKIQESMSDSFHRRVELGNLSWVLGLNGLAISTDKLALIESDGKPFLVSGQSEIGVAFMPLFRKQVIVKYVDFHNPEVFATQVGPGKWNFTDLLVPGPEIRFVQVEHGRLHLRNRITAEALKQPHTETVFANTNWQSYDFEDVNVKLIFPTMNQKRAWPFYLAFKLPREANGKKYTTAVSLTILATGTFEDWKQKKSTIELHAEQFNPADWRPFMRIPAGFSGMLSFDFKGDGIVDKSIAGDIRYNARNLSVVNGLETVFTALDANGAAKLAIGNKDLSWKNAQVSIGGVKLHSEGHLSDWQRQEPAYGARISADLRNLADLSDTSLWKYFPGAKKDSKDLTGSAVVDILFEGKGAEHKVFTSLNADQIPLGNLLATGTDGGAPLLSLFQIEPNAPIKGQIQIGQDQRILLKDVEIPAKGSTLKISGFIDAQKKEHEVFLQAQGLSLDRFDTRELAGHPINQHLKSSASALALSGKVDFNAHIKAAQGKQEIDIQAKLLQASLSSASAGTLANGLLGDIRFDGTTIKFDKIKGNLASVKGGVSGGALTFNGTMQTINNGLCNLEVSGQQIDIAQLVSFAKAAHLPIPNTTASDVRGTARDLNIRVIGKTAKPQLTLNLSPADLRYVVAGGRDGALKPLRAVGGNITLSDNILEFKNVVVAAGTNKMSVTASFDMRNDVVVAKLVHVRTTALDVKEALQYLQSPNMPADLRKNLASALAPLRFQSVEGKAYGDLTIRMNEQAPHFIEGVIGLTNLSGKAGERGVPFEGLSGLLAISGGDVAMQDMLVNSSGGKFRFTGSVKSFQEKPVWAARVWGRARGVDLQAMLPTNLAKSGLEITSVAPLSVRGNFTGDQNSLSGGLTMIAAAGDQMRLKNDVFSISQPANTQTTIDGSFVLNSSSAGNSLDLRSWHVTMGESVLQGTAHVAWSVDPNKNPAIDLIVSTPNPVPAAIGLGAFMPSIDAAGSTGTFKGTLAVAGELGNLLTHGELYLNKVTIPSMHIRNMEGKIDSPRWAISTVANETASSEARVYLSRADFGNADAREMHATIKVDSTGEQPKITLKDGNAVVAGGRVSMNGYCFPSSGKWRIEMALEKLQVDQFVTDMIEHSGELTGLADGKIVLSSTADGDSISNLSGNGEIAIYKGTAPRLGQLHEKLQTSNLLQQGIFGFNLNNVLHSMVHVKSGKFREVSMNFTINRGIVNIDRLNFDGADLRMRAAGDWNIARDTVDLEVAGNIPRVASSILPGAVGEVTRNFTLQKAVRVVTFRKLENLPSLPIIGDIGTDDPRAFTFKIAADLDSPDAVSKSIEKSFKWLPNKPNASAHPLPGL